MVVVVVVVVVVVAASVAQHVTGRNYSGVLIFFAVT
jgi:hypothetical protein